MTSHCYQHDWRKLESVAVTGGWAWRFRCAICASVVSDVTPYPPASASHHFDLSSDKSSQPANGRSSASQQAVNSRALRSK
jgi:hypothetical protein